MAQLVQVMVMPRSLANFCAMGLLAVAVRNMTEVIMLAL